MRWATWGIFMWNQNHMSYDWVMEVRILVNRVGKAEFKYGVYGRSEIGLVAEDDE